MPSLPFLLLPHAVWSGRSLVDWPLVAKGVSPEAELVGRGRDLDTLLEPAGRPGGYPAFRRRFLRSGPAGPGNPLAPAAGPHGRAPVVLLPVAGRLAEHSWPSAAPTADGRPRRLDAAPVTNPHLGGAQEPATAERAGYGGHPDGCGSAHSGLNRDRDLAGARWRPHPGGWSHRHPPRPPHHSAACLLAPQPGTCGGDLGTDAAACRHRRAGLAGCHRGAPTGRRSLAEAARELD